MEAKDLVRNTVRYRVQFVPGFRNRLPAPKVGTFSGFVKQGAMFSFPDRTCTIVAKDELADRVSVYKNYI